MSLNAALFQGAEVGGFLVIVLIGDVLCSHEVWNTALQCLSVLDVLLSLAEYARSEGGETCIPQFVLPSEESKV
jgi:hypothetical protein